MVPDDYVWEGDGVLPMRGWCQQDGRSCGLVATFMMLAYFRPEEFPFRELKKRCPVSPDKGTSLAEIGMALWSYGLTVRLTWQLTKREVDEAIEANSLILTSVNGNLTGYADNHAMVVHGTRSKEVLMAGHLDPASSSKWVSWKRLRESLDPAGLGMVVSGENIPCMLRL